MPRENFRPDTSIENRRGSLTVFRDAAIGAAIGITGAIVAIIDEPQNKLNNYVGVGLIFLASFYSLYRGIRNTQNRQNRHIQQFGISEIGNAPPNNDIKDIDYPQQ